MDPERTRLRDDEVRMMCMETSGRFIGCLGERNDTEEQEKKERSAFSREVKIGLISSIEENNR